MFPLLNPWLAVWTDWQTIWLNYWSSFFGLVGDEDHPTVVEKTGTE